MASARSHAQMIITEKTNKSAAMKYILWCAIAAAAACLMPACTQPSTTTSQTCPLDLSHAPTLRGLRLGMTAEELKARYPHIEIKTNHNVEGRSFADVYYGSRESNEFDFEGLTTIRLGLMDGRLSNIEFIYINESGYAQKPHELLDKVVGQLGLDVRWCGGSRTPICIIKCDGFEVSISTPETYISTGGVSISQPVVKFRNLLAEQKADAQRRSKETEEREKFRP